MYKAILFFVIFNLSVLYGQDHCPNSEAMPKDPLSGERIAPESSYIADLDSVISVSFGSLQNLYKVAGLNATEVSQQLQIWQKIRILHHDICRLSRCLGSKELKEQYPHRIIVKPIPSHPQGQHFESLPLEAFAALDQIEKSLRQLNDVVFGWEKK